MSLSIHNFELWFDRRGRAARAQALDRVAEKLNGLAGSTEQEFLRLGERLQEMVKAAQEHRAEITGLLQRVEGSSGPALAGVLDEVSRWSRLMNVQQGEACRFRGVLAVVAAVREPLGALSGVVRSLRVMGTLTRVESAHLGAQAAGFNALADEVSNLADAIDTKSSAILDAAHDVAELLSATQKTVAEIDHKHAAILETMTAECAGSVGEIREEEERLREITCSTGEQYASFAETVGDIVAALQIHDSTRQRVEHIVDGLRSASGGAADRSAAGHVVELQALQLGETRAAFLDAVGQIVADVDRLAAHVANCTNMAGQLLSARANSQRSFMAGLESRLEAIASSLCEMAASREAVRTAVERVRKACTQMTDFVSDIEAIGGRMLRLALNAEIQAVHLAETGVVMEAVASGIRSTSERALESARAADRALREVNLAASRMNACRDGEAAEGACSLAPRIRELSSELKTADQESGRLLALLAQGSDLLSREVASVRQGITAGRVFDEVSESCLVSLRDIVTKLTPRNVGAKKSIDALLHSGSYTMHAERAVHQAFAGTPHIAAEQACEAGELGQNVELF